MAGNHPDRELLTRYARGELIDPRKQRVRKHVSSCAICQHREHRLLSEAEIGPASIDYDHAITHAAESTFSFLKRLDEEGQNATGLLHDLEQCMPLEGSERISREPKLQSLKLFQLLQHRCRSAWSEQSFARAIDFAQMAVVMAGHLSESRY